MIDDVLIRYNRCDMARWIRSVIFTVGLDRNFLILFSGLVAPPPLVVVVVFGLDDDGLLGILSFVILRF